MRIIVCAKHVADSTEIRFDEAAGRPVLNNLPTKISDYDRNALEAAVTLKEQCSDVTIEVLMVGGQEAQKTLKEAVAMGADRGYLVEGGWDDPFNPLLSARVLTRAVEEIGLPDLLLCGLYSEDGYSGLTGAAMAELLGVPFVAPVSALTADDDGVEATIVLPQESWTLRAPFPCVLGVDSTMNVPRLPTVLQTMKVKADRLRSLKLSDLGLVSGNLRSELPSNGLEAYRTGAVDRKAVLIEGSPRDAAVELLQRLVEEGVLA